MCLELCQHYYIKTLIQQSIDFQINTIYYYYQHYTGASVKLYIGQ